MCVSRDHPTINLVCLLHLVRLQEGLPIKITENCPPSETGPVPLFPVSSLPSTQPPALDHTSSGLENDLREDSPIIARLMEEGVKRINLKKELRFIKELGSVSHVKERGEEMSRQY